jgi:hypothetical protein
MGMHHIPALDKNLEQVYTVSMMTFEEACKNADRHLDNGGSVFIVANQTLGGFFATNSASEIGTGRVLVYMSRYCGPWRSFDIVHAQVCGSA